MHFFVMMTKKELLQLVSDLSKKLEVALATIVTLREEIRVLKAGKNINNSSIPPSTDINRVSRSLREKSDKKPGGNLITKGN